LKLFTQFQMLLYSLLSALAAVIMTLAVISFIPMGKEQAVVESENDIAVLPVIPVPGGSGSVSLSGRTASDEESANIAIYERLNAAVVNITTQVVAYNWFLEPVPRDGGSGSGFIIDKKGYVLTNYHVVEDAFTVSLTLDDGMRFEGEVIGSDKENDLAIVKFDPGNEVLTTIPFGKSDTLKVGQRVLAIGNPFALERTMTTGITDASINPGNSGGPLLNSKGEMIGINTMIYSPSGGSVGIGFAVPVNTARRVVPDLIKFGKVKRGWIDIIPVQIFSSLERYAKLPVSEGILISRVVDGGNADEAGLRGGSSGRPVRYGSTVLYLGGDIITNLDGAAVGSFIDLYGILEDKKPGDPIVIGYLRNGRMKETTLILSERPDEFQWE